MGNGSRKILAPGRLAMSLACLMHTMTAWAGYYDTTGSPDGSATNKKGQRPNGGFTDADMQAMDAQQRQSLIILREGRLSSMQKGSSDFAVDLDIHDANQDGVTDHDNPNNGLEGPMDEIAIGKRGMRGQARWNALKKATDEVNDCLKRQLAAPPGVILHCESASPILINVGSAHGGENETHRVNKLKTEALKASQDAGKNAAAKVLTKAGQVKNASGQKVAANIDLLRDQVAFLTNMQDKVIKDAAKYYTAKRLLREEGQNLGSGNGGTNGVADTEIGELIANGASDDEIAQRIAEKDELSTKKVCVNRNAQPALCLADPNFNEVNDCDQPAMGNQPAVVKKYDCKTLREYAKHGSSPDVLNGLYAAARKTLAKSDPNGLKMIAANKKKILDNNCLKDSVWCYDSIHAASAAAREAKGNSTKEAKLLEDKTFADVGPQINNTYDDTQELIYKQLAVAREGGLDNFQTTFENGAIKSDFNNYTDTKGDASNRVYGEFMDNVKLVQKNTRDLTAYERKKVEIMRGESTLVTEDPYTGKPLAEPYFVGGYRDYQQNQFNNKLTFDPSKMNAGQLYGLDTSRDGLMTAGLKDRSPAATPTPGLANTTTRTRTIAVPGASAPAPAPAGEAYVPSPL